jgi:hypothetical protein
VYTKWEKLTVKDNEVQDETEKVLRQAQKVINDANRAIAKTDAYFKEHNISYDRLIAYLENYADDDLYKNIQSMLSDAIRESQMEAHSKVNSVGLKSGKSIALKKLNKTV